jgi:hypothetical protein
MSKASGLVDAMEKWLDARENYWGNDHAGSTENRTMLAARTELVRALEDLETPDAPPGLAGDAEPTYWPVNPFCTCGLSSTEATGVGCPVHGKMLSRTAPSRHREIPGLLES